MDLASLTTAYQAARDTPSDIHLHLPRLAEFASGADHVIELGCRSGVSTTAFLHGLPPDGRLTSIDLAPPPDLGFFDHRWTFIQGDDRDPDVYQRLGAADVVFIDTSHRYDHTVSELHLYRWLVRPGGVIVCHDTELEQPVDAPPRPRFPVRRAVEEFCSETGFEWSNDPRCFGLGVIEVR